MNAPLPTHLLSPQDTVAAAAYILTPAATVRRVFNMTALAVASAAARAA